MVDQNDLFPMGPTVFKFNFTNSETKIKTFYTKKLLLAKYQFQNQGARGLPCPPPIPKTMSKADACIVRDPIHARPRQRRAETAIVTCPRPRPTLRVAHFLLISCTSRQLPVLLGQTFTSRQLPVLLGQTFTSRQLPVLLGQTFSNFRQKCSGSATTT